MPEDSQRTRADMGDLKDLQPISKRINPATDELNASLQAIQDRLNALAIGVEVWLKTPALHESPYRQIIDPDREEPTGEREFDEVQLGYGRLGDKWALLVRTRRYVDAGPDGYGGRDVTEYDDGDKEIALLHAARELRVAAVGLIPKLIDALRDKAARVISSVEQAKAIADSLLEK